MEGISFVTIIFLGCYYDGLWNQLTFGSKLVTKNQKDYFGKGLQILSPKKLLHAHEFLNEIFCSLF
jgi:hypothetical protein